MDILKIREKWESGEYHHNIVYGIKLKSDHIFDENLSVKRNRELVEEYNANVDALRKEATSKQAELSRKLKHDVCCFITEYYNLDYEAAEKIEAFCSVEYHSNMYSYFDYIPAIADLVDSIVCQGSDELNDV